MPSDPMPDAAAAPLVDAGSSDAAPLRRALEEERALLDRLAHVASALTAEREPERLMQRLTDEATSLVGAQFGAFFHNLVRADGESYLLYTLSGAPREAFDRFGMPRNTKVFAPTFAGEGVVRVDDITKDPRYGQNHPRRGMPEGHLPVRSYLAVPVRTLKGDVLGGLFFGHAEVGRFGEREERSAVAVSAIAGPALENARLFEQLAAQKAELDAANVRHRLVTEATQEGIWFWDVPTNAVTWNDALLAAMGIDRASWGGTFDDWFSRLHPDDQPRLATALEDHLERRVPYRMELFRLRHASGEYRWFTTVGQADWSEDGRPLRMAGSVRDVTDKKLAEDDLRRALVSQRALAEASAILSRSIDYGETLANVARAMVPAVSDWCAVDVLAKDGEVERIAVAHPDPAKVKLAYELQRRYPEPKDSPHGLHAVLRTGTPAIYPEIPDELLVASAQDEEHLSIARALGLSAAIIVPMTAHGKVLGAISFVAEGGRRFDERDLAFAEELARRASTAVENALLYREVRALNASLERRVEERTSALLEANKELESFSYTVSHDLRAPIRHISGFVDLLKTNAGERLDDKSRHYVDTIKAAAMQMGTLIDGLLAFSRLGRADLAKRRVSLRPLVDGVLRECEPDTRGREIAWTIGDLPEVAADSTMLRLVLTNLVGNAIKYTRVRAPAHIEVGARDDGAEVVVWVRDDGAGFNMAYAHKLFGVFQRLHSDREFEGTGIGLATARRIVHRHGGRMWAEGAEGAGATFYFTLPKESIA